MTLQEITASITAIKTATQLTKSILTLNKDTAVNEKAIELQSAIISVQASMLDLQSNYHELLQSKENIEKELLSLKDWDKIESQYDLFEINRDVFVYIPNENHPQHKPRHYLCTNCFQKNKISLLQLRKRKNSGYGYYY